MNQKRPGSRHLGRLLGLSILLAGMLLAALFYLLATPSATAHAPVAFRPIPPAAFVPVYAPTTAPNASLTPTMAPTPTPKPTPRPRPTVAPTPRPVVTKNSLTGVATWYCLPGVSVCMRVHPTGGMYAAAGPALRAALGSHWRGQVVTVCAGTCVRVTLADWCACGGGHTIDLYSDAFRQLAPLSRGAIGVTIRW